ncbi:hypothetical protein IF1G_11112 [Cordyceps javanica]|uniref:Uncharacterized protein n=1 Tax=Cordyceps javanica TaxID=43265 RepID=A0A545UL82_9HYPO|nr:hypothetical protein IF1G_11112 [Cordyceps javanica]TQW01666.1 hypothetical protein IF2G_10807 [Cordyceps javanica]
MNHSNELYVVYTCNRTEMRSLLDNIVKCLPSLTTTVQGEAANGKMLHYDETSETRSLGTFIHNNVSFAPDDD